MHESMNQPIPRHLLSACCILSALLTAAMGRKVQKETFSSIHSWHTWGGRRGKGRDPRDCGLVHVLWTHAAPHAGHAQAIPALGNRQPHLRPLSSPDADGVML